MTSTGSKAYSLEGLAQLHNSRFVTPNLPFVRRNRQVERLGSARSKSIALRLFKLDDERCLRFLVRIISFSWDRLQD